MDYNTYYMSVLGFKSKNNEDDGNIDLNCPLPYAVSYQLCTRDVGWKS